MTNNFVRTNLDTCRLLERCFRAMAEALRLETEQASISEVCGLRDCIKASIKGAVSEYLSEEDVELAVPKILASLKCIQAEQVRAHLMLARHKAKVAQKATRNQTIATMAFASYSNREIAAATGISLSLAEKLAAEAIKERNHENRRNSVGPGVGRHASACR